ncbi:group 2 family glycosyl transferase [Corallococcus macrosporus]|uniref:dolichyl-phosphate beta-glucosyltransferase n=1 Tax=Myxococcus fulvus (strain ATCC BAA-855 / HW-1) TaxID=483219 RepID=F8CHU9_MYXFH|nr:group 2 family glycosyl transferase [Corallococcus macrosporus]
MTARPHLCSIALVQAPSVSVVIPAYNEGQRLPRFVAELTRVFLERSAPPVEFVVVDDGSTPEHAELQRASVNEAQARLTSEASPHQFTYVAAPRNQGKGSAIRLGWRHASAGVAWLAFLDADGAINAEEFHRLVELSASGTAKNVDVLAGSRILMAGRRVVRNLHRHLQGRIFATLTDANFKLHFYDTQCGVKFVRADLLRPLLDVLQEQRWLLDVELLVLLKRQGARFLEVPIDWEDFGGSKVIPGLDAARMLWGLMRLRRRLERVSLPTLRDALPEGGPHGQQ